MIQNYFKQSVLVQTPTKSISTTTGETVEKWSTGTTVKASIRPLSLDKQYIQNKSYALVTHRMYSTYLPDVNDRVYYDSRYYQIMSIIDPMTMGRFYQVDMRHVS